jgi:hypothetical protein
MNVNHFSEGSGRSLIKALNRYLGTQTGEQNIKTQMLQPVAQELHLFSAVKLDRCCTKLSDRPCVYPW